MSKKIPFLDLKKQYEPLKEEIQRALTGVLERQEFILGREVERFEKDFAAYCETAEAVGVNSGTSALWLALLALDIGPGDEVITVAHTFIGTAEAVSWTGARPVFIDVDPVTMTMDPARIEAAVSSRTKAIIPVHLYGQPADMEPVLKAARRHSLYVIEDAAQAHGARYQEKRAGSLADAACFSFYPGKNLGAYGEAGAVTTGNAALAAEIRKLRNHGGLVRYEHERIGFNARMDAFQGAVLNVKLPFLDGWNEARRKAARVYSERLAGAAGLALPAVRSGSESVFHSYVLQCDARDALADFLAKEGIPTMIYYPRPIHLWPFYRELGYQEGSLPVTEQLAQRVLSLPLYPELSEKDIEWIAERIRAFQLPPVGLRSG